MMPILAKREFQLIERAGTRIEEVLRWHDARFYAVVDTVSMWSPAQQLHHAALVKLAVGERIMTLYEDDSQEIVRSGGPSGAGWMALTFSRIPRGRAKAPEAFEPPPEVSRAEVQIALHHARQKFAMLAPKASYLYEARGRLPHPGLGNLNALQWLKFARLHTFHHLAIAEEIGAAFEARRR